MAEIDKATGLLYQIKRPSPEVRKYSVDFRKFLTAIASVTSVTAAKRSLTTETIPLTISSISFTGTIVYFNLSGGTDKEDYEITIILVDTFGNIISEDVLIKVRKAGLL